MINIEAVCQIPAEDLRLSEEEFSATYPEAAEAFAEIDRSMEWSIRHQQELDAEAIYATEHPEQYAEDQRREMEIVAEQLPVESETDVEIPF